MLLGSVDYPVELLLDLLNRWFSTAEPQKLLEDPWIAERPARQQHRRDARLVVSLLRLPGARQATCQQDRRRQGLSQLARQLVIRLALVLLGRVARVERDRGDPRVLDQAAGHVEATPVPWHESRAQFHR